MTARQQEAVSFFLTNTKIVHLEPLGSGNVNDTWLVVTGTTEKYVLQRLNPNVFADPGLVQENLYRVTCHLQERLADFDPETRFTVLQIICNPDGIHRYIDQEGALWRMFVYIADTLSLNTVTSPAQAREIGRFLGLFHRLTASLAHSSLPDSLPGFHCTPLYLKQYEEIRPAGIDIAPKCRDFIHDRRKDVFLLEDECIKKTIRQQVIHGDPKVANFLFSKDGNRVISLIDLDTVKPGLLLHDIGDCFRSCCNRQGEEVVAAEDVVFDQDLFSAALAGYLSHGLDLLTERDKELLVDSVRLISFELGLRFYSDHLIGNRYFKISRPGQNLFRAQIQFALVRSIENQYTELMEIVRSYSGGGKSSVHS